MMFEIANAIWETTISALSEWYVLLIILFAIVGIYGTAKHNKAIPSLWAMINALILVMGAIYIEPLIFGGLHYELWSLEFILTSIFGIAYGILNMFFIINIVQNGQLHEKNPKRKSKNAGMVAGIFCIIAVGILLMPVAIGSYVETETIDNIITVQGSYGTGEPLGLYSGSLNVSEIFADIMPASATDNPLGWDSNNDSVFWGYKDEGIASERDGQYYGNYFTYSGNNTYIGNVNSSTLPPATYDAYRYLYMPLNISTGELAEFDFVRIHTNIDQTEINSFALTVITNPYSTNSIYTETIDNDTEIAIIDYGYKTLLKAYPNGTVWLKISGTGDFIAEDSEIFTVNIEANTLDPEDYLFGSQYTDSTVWIITVLIMDFVYVVAVIFATPWIDAVIDKN